MVCICVLPVHDEQAAMHTVIAIPHTVIGRQHSRIQVIQILWAGTDKLRQRVSDVIPFAKEYTIRTQTWKDKPCVFDQHAAKSHDFFECEFVLSCLGWNLKQGNI